MADDPALEPGFPAFEAIAKQLYGDALDARELWVLTKFAPDSADLHNDGAAKKKSNRAQHLGLAATGLAATGGVHALYMTGQKLKQDVKAPEAAAKEAPKLLGKIPVSPKAAAVTAGAGWLALHAAELGGDAAGAHAQVKVMRQKKADAAAAAKPKADTLGKGLLTRKVVMSDEQAALTRQALARGSRNGARAVAGGALVAGLAAGATLGAKHARKKAFRQMQQSNEVEKAFRVKPLNAVDAPRVVTLKARKPPMAPPLAKSLSWVGEISKLDVDKRLVFGWCSLSKVDGKDVVDLQGDFVPLEEIEKSAYKYVIESRKGGDMHKRVSKTAGDQPLHTADMVESFVVTPEKLRGMGLPEDALPHGWWVGFKVNDDDQWAKVKSGERAGFSIHGTGQRRAAA